MKKISILFIIMVVSSLSSFTFSNDYKEVENVVELELSFINNIWDGISVPDGQQCLSFGGNGSSPEILVKNIPTGANALIISFSDRTFKANDLGGHGIIGLWIENNETTIIVPSVPGETNELPEGMFIEAKFRSNRGKDGAYLPPCSGGRGNEYYATVKAVYKSNSDDESLLLGKADIEMGKY